MTKSPRGNLRDFSHVYAAFFARSRHYSEKVSAILARAVILKSQAEGMDPHSDEVHQAFIELADVQCPLAMEPEDYALFDGLAWLMGLTPVVPGWLDPILKDLDWPRLLLVLDPHRHEVFVKRARDLGLFPNPVERLRSWSSPTLPPALLEEVLKDPSCRHAWLETISRQDVVAHLSSVFQILRATTDVAIRSEFIGVIVADFDLHDAERQPALHEPVRFLEICLSARQHDPFARMLVRFQLDPAATWDRLGELPDQGLINLIRQWSAEIAKGNPWKPEDTISLYVPILDEALKRGKPFAGTLTAQLLADPPPPDAAEEDWRAVLLDLSNVLLHGCFHAGREPKPIPSLNAYHELLARLQPLWSSAIGSYTGSNPDLLSPWIALVEKSQLGIRTVAAKLVDLALEGLAKTGNWSSLAKVALLLTGQGQRYDGLRYTLKREVAAAAGRADRGSCQEFLLGFIDRSDDPTFAAELAVTYALQSRVESRDPLSTPEKADLSALCQAWHEGEAPADDDVVLAENLKANPALLDALVAQWKRLSPGPVHWIRLPGDLDRPIGLSRLLYATGDERLDRAAEKCPWPRPVHLVRWHLAAGNGFQELLKDAFDTPDKDLPALIAVIAPDKVDKALVALLDHASDDRAVDLIQTVNDNLGKAILLARNPDVRGDIKVHDGWRPFVQSYDEPEGVDFNPSYERYPQRRIEIVDKMFRRLTALATPENPRARQLLAFFATLLAKHPAYPMLVTPELERTLVDTAKQTLMSFRTKAVVVREGDLEPGPDLDVAVSVLCVFKDFSVALRQLLLIYRDIPFPSVGPSLATHDPDGKRPLWSAVPRLITSLIRNSPKDQRDGIRYMFADYLQDRLKPRISNVAKEAAKVASGHPTMIEPDPVLREAYVEALTDLHIDRGGRVHHQLGNVALHDPSEAVQEAARRCAARARRADPSQGSVARMILNSWWSIRRGSTLRFGADKVGPEAPNTRVLEAKFIRGDLH